MQRKLFDAQLAQYDINKVSSQPEVKVEDGIRSYLPGMQVAGNTYQRSYKGHNLIDKEQFQQAMLKYETFGKMHVNTAMEAGKVAKFLKAGQTYTISYEIEGQTGTPSNATSTSNYVGFIFRPVTAAEGKVPWIYLNSSKNAKAGEILQYSKTFTVSSNYEPGDYYLIAYTGRYVIDGVGTVLEACIRNVQLVEGSTKKDYEPYTYNSPTPCPAHKITKYATEEVITTTEDVFADLTNYIYDSSNPYAVVVNHPIVLPVDGDADVEYTPYDTQDDADELVIGDLTSILEGTGNYEVICNGLDHTVFIGTINPNDYPNGLYIGIRNDLGIFTPENIPNYLTLAKNTNLTFIQKQQVQTNVISVPDYPEQLQFFNDNSTSPLPPEYQQVEYIESSGAQVIETNVMSSPSLTIEADVKFTVQYTEEDGTHANGLGYGSTRLAFGYVPKLVPSNFLVAIAGNNFDTGVPFDTERHLFKVYGHGGWVIDGQSKILSLTTTFEPAATIPIFCLRNSSGVYGSFADMRLYGYKIYDKKILVRNFVPCYRKSDDEIGLYETVHNVFYTNIGTGAFTKGADIISKHNQLVVHGKNLATAYQFTKDFPSYKEVEYEGKKCITYKQNNNKYFVLEGGFKPNTQYTISFNVRSEGTNNGAAAYFLYDGVSVSNDDVISAGSTEWKQVVKTSRAGKTVKGIGLINADYRRTIYIDVDSFMLEEGAVTTPEYEPPHPWQIIDIPATVDVNGETIQLTMTKYDKIVLDKANEKVYYSQGGWQRALKGKDSSDANDRETWSTGGYAGQNGYGVYYFLPIPYCYGFTNVTNTGYCSHFRYVNAQHPQPDNSFSSTSSVASFVFDREVPLADFKTYLQNKYAEGDPVILVLKRTQPIIHDISNTNFGQQLLNLTNWTGTTIVRTINTFKETPPTITVDYLTHK